MSFNTITVEGIEFSTYPGETPAGNIGVLFFAVHSAKYSIEIEGYSLNASDEAIASLLQIADNFQLYLSSAVGAVGGLLAHANHNDVSEYIYQDSGFTLSGLGELQNLINDASSRLVEIQKSRLKNLLTNQRKSVKPGESHE